jgi:branched-chain amino acid transport system permease protein
MLSPLAETIFQFMLRDALLGLSVYLTLRAGMFSLANAGFMAIGAYVGAVLLKSYAVPFGLAIPIAVLVCGLIALPIALPILRLRDIYLAIATIGFGEVVRIIIINFDDIATSLSQAYEPLVLTNGGSGLSGIPKLAQTWHLLLALLLVALFIHRLERSRFGRAMAATRQDERAATSMGINVVYIKVLIFVLSAMLAGLAGCFDAFLSRAIRPNDYGFTQAVNILAYAVLGGTTTLIGPIVGGFSLRLLPELLRFSQQYRGVMIGSVLLIVMIYFPGGLFNPAAWRRLWARWQAKRQT